MISGRARARLTAIVLAACTGAALAQVPPDAGTTLRQLEPPVLTLPRKPPPPIDVEAPARPALTPAPAVRFELKALRISGATVFAGAELQAIVREFIGREVGIADLGEAVGRITGFYADRGYPLATAYLPAQSIEGGVVEILVLEGRYGEINVANRSHVTDSIVLRHVRSLQAGVVEGALLERKLLLLHDLPGAAPGRSILAPGRAVGETDLRIELDPGRAAAGSIELDNYGSRFTGATRLSGQVDIYSPLRLGDWLSVRAAKGDPGLEYGRVGYQLPVGGDGLRLGAIYSHVEYRLGKDFAVLDAKGEADTWSLIASYPILRSRRHNLHAKLIAERKDLHDRVDAIGTVSERSSTAAAVSLQGDYFDAFGGGGSSAYSLAYTAGTLRVETPAQRAIDDATARTHGQFHRWNVAFARQQLLAGRASLYVSFFGQKAGKNLDSSEKMILGGINGVRAYPQGEAPGDSGYLLTLELRHAFDFAVMPGLWQAAAFLDTGEVKISENPFAAQDNRRRLSGGGLGLEWSQPAGFMLRLALAHRIGNERATAGSDDRARAWLQAIKYF